MEIAQVIPSIIIEGRYFDTHNFIGERIDGYHSGKIYLTREATNALKEVQEELQSLSLSLKIYDAYRPQTAVNHFVRWAENLSDTTMKAENYPEVEKRHLFRDGYISARSGHSRGSTLDLTIVALPAAPQEQYSSSVLKDCRSDAASRFKDNSPDMGTGYD